MRPACGRSGFVSGKRRDVNRGAMVMGSWLTNNKKRTDNGKVFPNCVDWQAWRGPSVRANGDGVCSCQRRRPWPRAVVLHAAWNGQAECGLSSQIVEVLIVKMKKYGNRAIDMKKFPLPPGSCLTVIRMAPRQKRFSLRWLCRCSCGKTVTVAGDHLRAGLIRSCGHLLKEGNNSRTHGQSFSPTYSSWRSMTRLVRLRGAKVCSQWLGRGGFQVFLADMGEKPLGLNIVVGRKDMGRPYEPENCEWSTLAVQIQRGHAYRRARKLCAS